jgi:hypothetical protein
MFKKKHFVQTVLGGGISSYVVITMSIINIVPSFYTYLTTFKTSGRPDQIFKFVDGGDQAVEQVVVVVVRIQLKVSQSFTQ